jgi:predicted metal-dependent hydrolase
MVLRCGMSSGARTLRTAPETVSVMEMPYAPPEQIALPDGPAPIRWMRSRQARCITLRIDPRDAMVVVTLPRRATHATAMALLVDHSVWISERLAALPAHVAFADGAVVPLAGLPHRIRHLPQHVGVALGDGHIEVGGDAAGLAQAVAGFLCAEANRRLTGMALEKAARIGCAVRQVVVKEARSRWGSCSPDGALMFNWRLVLAPEPVQDYVTAHEVAHLCHMNHGPLFAELVDQLTPHAMFAKAWLTREGAGLLRIG